MALQTIHGRGVDISRLSKSFKATKAIDDVSLSVRGGEFLALLGPSGCGKTTLLRAIAGLAKPDVGRIGFDATTIFDSEARLCLPAERRNVGMVFQDYALWPHLRVRDNVGFPLRARRVPKDRHSDLIAAALKRVGLLHLSDRFPGELSGGQQQRVALARATVDMPGILLFDEPLSNLDAALRESLGREIRNLVRELGATALYVTHDQGEALSLADRVAVMRDGKIVQIESPQALYAAPADLWTAKFLRAGNLVSGVARDGAFQPHGAKAALTLPRLINGHVGPLTLMVPGSALRVVAGSDLLLRVVETQFRGDRYEVSALWGDSEAGPVVHFWHDCALPVGDLVPASVDASRLAIFPEELN